MIYYFHPKIKYSIFKKINKELYRGWGMDIVPMHFDKIIWQLLRDRKLNIGVNTKSKDCVFLSLKQLPKNAKFLSNPKKLNS